MSTRASIEEKIQKLWKLDPKSEAFDKLHAECLEEIRAYWADDQFVALEGGAICAGDPEEPSLQKICVTNKDATDLIDALRTEKCVALEGSPGYGRVFAALELAYAMIGMEDRNRVAVAQFDSACTYDDCMGAPSIIDNFLARRGLFYNFCRQASKSSEPYVFIIHETSPGCIDAVFREIEELIRTGQGQETLEMIYGETVPFKIPENVYILALLAVTGDQKQTPVMFTDHTLKASMKLDELQKMAAGEDREELRELLEFVEAINHVVESETSLGEKYALEENYMCACALAGGDDVLAFEVHSDLLPLIYEYCSAWLQEWNQRRKS